MIALATVSLVELQLNRAGIKAYHYTIGGHISNPERPKQYVDECLPSALVLGLLDLQQISSVITTRERLEHTVQ